MRRSWPLFILVWLSELNYDEENARLFTHNATIRINLKDVEIYLNSSASKFLSLLKMWLVLR
jgi:hypothetical protein